MHDVTRMYLFGHVCVCAGCWVLSKHLHSRMSLRHKAFHIISIAIQLNISTTRIRNNYTRRNTIVERLLLRAIQCIWCQFEIKPALITGENTMYARVERG